MLLIGEYCRWKKKESFGRSFNAYYNGSISHRGIEPWRKLKCSGSTLDLKKLHGIWQIRCGPYILYCLQVEAKQFGLMFIYVWHMIC